MLNFEYSSPTKFIFGKDMEKQVGKIIADFSGRNVLVHFGGGSIIQSGLYDRVLASLEESAITHVELGGVQPNPRSSLVYEGIEICRQKKIDFILAVGGGSVIDSAKAIAIGTPYHSDFWDFYDGKATALNSLSVGVVLTIPASGSEGSSGSVITLEDGKLKRSYANEIMRPKFAILNPELTYTLPAYQTASGAVDIMAHVLERYFTNIKGVDLTDRLGESIIQTIVKYAPIALEEPDNYEARGNMMWAGTLAHIDLCGTGREADWSSHQMEHELSALYDVAHGAGLAVILPAWMRYQYKHDVMRFAQLAVRVWGCDMDYQNPESSALAGIERMEHFFKTLGMPNSFEELGAKKKDIPLLTSKVALNNGDRLGYFHPLNRQQIAEVFNYACRDK